MRRQFLFALRWSFVVPWLLVNAAFAAAADVPELALKDLEGREHAVREFIGKGKWVVVAVWSADCPVCRREIYHMTFFHEENRKKGREVLGLSIDGWQNVEKARAFARDQALNFPNLVGDPETPIQLTGTLFIGTPTYYIFSPDGRLRAQRLGAVTQEQMESLIAELEAKETSNTRPQRR